MGRLFLILILILCGFSSYPDVNANLPPPTKASTPPPTASGPLPAVIPPPSSHCDHHPQPECGL